MKCEICGDGYKCIVCGKSMCLQEIGGELRPHNHEDGYLCPTHYKQVEECINILKGEREPKPLPLYKGAPSGHPATYGVFVSPSEIWMSGVKFVPEKAPEWDIHLEGDCYRVRRDGPDGREYYAITPEAATALYAFMEKERGQV